MDSEVWLLMVHHRHGDDVTVYTSEPAARGGLFDYVAQCWAEIAGGEYETSAGVKAIVPQEIPGDPDTAIEIYFQAHKDGEIFAIDQKPVNS